MKSSLRDNEDGNSKTYLIPYGSRIKVQDGQYLEAGDELTEGSVNPWVTFLEDQGRPVLFRII